MKSDKNVTKIKRVTFFLRHSVDGNGSSILFTTVALGSEL